MGSLHKSSLWVPHGGSLVLVSKIKAEKIGAGWLDYDPDADTVTWLGPVQIYSTEEHQLEKA